MEAQTLFGIQVMDLEPVTVTVEEREERVRGKPFPAKLYRRKGLARYTEPDGSERLADEAAFYDCGPDGVSRTYILHKDAVPTEEEREAGRRRIREIAAQALISQGIW